MADAPEIDREYVRNLAEWDQLLAEDRELLLRGVDLAKRKNRLIRYFSERNRKMYGLKDHG